MSSVSRVAATGATVLTLMSYFSPSSFRVFISPQQGQLGRGVVGLAEIAVQPGRRTWSG